jgi:putative FmdB family regulatory protein
MPLYEYSCPDCHRDCELLIRGDDRPICPTCGGKRLNKLLSVPAAHTAGGAKDLPICGPRPSGNCGLPQCGMGGCMM